MKHAARNLMSDVFSKINKTIWSVFFFHSVSNIYFVKWMFKGFRQIIRTSEFQQTFCRYYVEWISNLCYSTPHKVSSKATKKMSIAVEKYQTMVTFQLLPLLSTILMCTYKWSVIFWNGSKEWNYLCAPFPSSYINGWQKRERT